MRGTGPHSQGKQGVYQLKQGSPLPLNQAPLTRTSTFVLSEERRSHSWCAQPPLCATSASAHVATLSLQMFSTTDASTIDKAQLRPSLRSRVSAFSAALKPVSVLLAAIVAVDLWPTPTSLCAEEAWSARINDRAFGTPV